MTDAGVESMLDFICVSRIGLHGMLMCCVVCGVSSLILQHSYFYVQRCIQQG